MERLSAAGLVLVGVVLGIALTLGYVGLTGGWYANALRCPWITPGHLLDRLSPGSRLDGYRSG